jgi:hypothetical protein
MIKRLIKLKEKIFLTDEIIFCKLLHNILLKLLEIFDLTI